MKNVKVPLTLSQEEKNYLICFNPNCTTSKGLLLISFECVKRQRTGKCPGVIDTSLSSKEKPEVKQ